MLESEGGFKAENRSPRPLITGDPHRLTLPIGTPIIPIVPAGVSIRVFFCLLCHPVRNFPKKSREVSQERHARLLRLILEPDGNLKEFLTQMKRSIALAALLASGLALSATAQSLPAPGTTPSAATAAAPAGPAKIAVIAFQLAAAQTNKRQRDFADLQEEVRAERGHSQDSQLEMRSTP